MSTVARWRLWEVVSILKKDHEDLFCANLLNCLAEAFPARLMHDGFDYYLQVYT